MGSQPTAGRLSLLTPLENYQSLKDTMPSLWQWIGYPSTSMPCPPLPQLTLQELHTFSLSMSGGTTDFQRPSSVTEGVPSYPTSQENWLHSLISNSPPTLHTTHRQTDRWSE